MSRPATRTLFALAATASLVAALSSRPPPAPGSGDPPPATPLAAGSEFRGSLPETGGSDRFRLELKRGEALRGQVLQQGLDLVADLRSPGGELVLASDSPTGSEGVELICYVAVEDGLYGLEVRPWQAGGGSYALRIEHVGPPRPSDFACWWGLRLFIESEELRRRHGPSPALAASYAAAAAAFHEGQAPYHEGLAWRQRARLAEARHDLRPEVRDLERALQAFRSAGAVAQQVVVLGRLGRSRLRLADGAGAEAALTEALDLARRHRDPVSEARARNELALLWMERGEAHRAVEELERVLSLWRALGRGDEAADTLHNLGAAYAEELGRFPEALDLLGEALTHWRGDEQVQRRANTLILMAWATDRSGEPERAVELYRQALALSRSFGDGALTAAALDRMATALGHLGRDGEALLAYEESLAISLAAGDRRNQAHTRGNLGWLLLRRGQLEEARRELTAALGLLKSQEDRDARAHVLAGLARTRRATGDADGARRAFEDALDLLEELRGSALRQGDRLPPDALWQDYYEAYVDLLLDPAIGRVDPAAARRAFEIVELVRARNLAEMLREADVDLRGSADPALLAHERALLTAGAEIESRRQAAAAGAPASRRTELAREQRMLSLRLDRLRAAIRASSPRFPEIWDPRPATLTEIQALLDDDERIVSLALGEERSHRFVVGRDLFEWHALPARRQLESLALQVHREFSVPGGRTEARTALLLSQAVLAGLELPRGARLLVVPDGALRYVPFAALPLLEHKGEVLLDAHRVVQLPSSALLPSLDRRPRRRSAHDLELAVVGDSVFSPRDPRLAGTAVPAAARGGGPQLSLLPHVRREAEAILALVPAERHVAALGFAARRDLVLGGALERVRVVHLATHAIVDEDQPGRSRLVLSRFDQRGTPLLGDLSLNDVFALRLRADLVVLSACGTALGRPVRGEGLTGFSHGFFHAGAGGLVVSLWNVGDAATAALMEAFYRAMLRDGLPPAAALREAQLTLRADQRWSDPYYWSGFIAQTR